MPNLKTFLLRNTSTAASLEERINASLDKRIAESKEFNLEEILDVSKKNTSLFDKGYILNKEQYEKFSVLCSLSQCSLKTYSQPSHRKYIGPLIDSFKKILFRMFDSRYSAKFEALEEFNMKLIVNQASISATMRPQLKENVSN